MRRIRKTAAIIAVKTAVLLSRIIGNKGTSTPGMIGLKIYPDLLKELSMNVKEDIIIVGGTNGKTTTNNMICDLLENKGFSLVSNRLGANMLYGIATCFALSSNLWGNKKWDYACLETDEASMKKIFKEIKPSRILITNLFRDQLDRYGEIDITINHIKEAMELSNNAKLVLNADDPLSSYFGNYNKEKSLYFGIKKTFNENKSEIREGRFCLKCHSELEYSYYHFSQLGYYKCTECHVKRPDPDLEAVDVNFEKGLRFKVINGNEDMEIDVSYIGFYNIYNIIGSMCMLKSLGVDLNDSNKVFQKYLPQIGRMEKFNLGKEIILSLAKNPSGFNQNIETVHMDKRKKDILVLINDNEQDGTDISWIWDVDFERFQKDNIGTFILTGTRKEDLHIRFKYFYNDYKKCLLLDKPKDAIKMLLSKDGDVGYVLVNYTGLFESQKILKKFEKRRPK